MRVMNRYFDICTIVRFLVFIFISLFPKAIYPQDVVIYKGTVVSKETKTPIAGVTIKINGVNNKTISSETGQFIIQGSKTSNKVFFNHLGYQQLELLIDTNHTILDVEMVKESGLIDEVLVTGMFERKKESFSGAAKSITGAELRQMGNQNIIQSLRSLDPSFILLDNNLKGADPNALARIELRGKTSFVIDDNVGAIRDQVTVDPNLPLFILDGFESTLRQITDLNINRIASVTILKDAASTSMYGARSANGVVVVETIKLREGEIKLDYTTDFSFGVPDLRDYNMMNAAEKLEIERLAGLYNEEGNYYFAHMGMARLYNERLKLVESKVNTYWLKVPLNNVSTSVNNSLNVSGGSGSFQYNIGGNYKNTNGLMKGTGRKNWGGNVNFNYRHDKINISNTLFLNGFHATELPTGSFATYARLAPYYLKTEQGKYLASIPREELAGEVTRYENVDNPIYNSTLNSEKYSKSTTIINNFGVNYTVSNSLKLTGALQVIKDDINNILFISPLDTRFDEVANLLEKGSYTNGTSKNLDYSGNLGAVFNKIIKEKHVLTGNGRVEFQSLQNSFIAFSAIGFPADVAGNPAFAYSYALNSSPEVSNPPKIRRLNSVLSTNYMFDNRYFADFTYRVDGANTFGVDNKYTTFWAFGLGWNLNKEKFLIDNKSVDYLKIRANIGTSGNQNFRNLLSSTVYDLESTSNPFGLGYYHDNKGNPNLHWQKTLQTSVGVEFGLWNKRLFGNISAFNKKTDPLVVPIQLPLSTGVDIYNINTGNLNYYGLEFEMKYAPIMRPQNRLIWTLGLMGSMYKSEYGRFGNTMENINEKLKSSAYLQRFTDGKSPDDLWSYQSLGIDPSNGLEVFLNNDGTYVYDYSLADIKVVGNARPTIEGVISNQFRYKDFTFNVALRYSLGSSRFNTALYNKVENLNRTTLEGNLDKRALQSRWEQPGDATLFKRISYVDYSPISSRFIQKENYLNGESLSIGYQLFSRSSKWLQAAKINSLQFTGYANNIFRFSTILAERGLEYPFSNNFSFSVNASF